MVLNEMMLAIKLICKSITRLLLVCGIGREDKAHRILDAIYQKFYEIILDATLVSQMKKYELL